MALGIGLGIGFNQVRGRVLRNILGTDGSCDSLDPFELSGVFPTLATEPKKSGLYSIKSTPSNGFSSAIKNYDYVLDKSKSYLLAFWVYIESYTSGNFGVRLRETDASSTRYTAYASNSIIGEWQFVYVKIPTNNNFVLPGFRLTIGPGQNSTLIAYIDEIRIYEVSAEDYDKVGTTWTATSTPSIDDIFPYRG